MNSFTRFLLMISVWTGLNPVNEDEREGLRLPQDEELDLDAEDEKDDVEDAKDPTSDIFNVSEYELPGGHVFTIT